MKRLSRTAQAVALFMLAGTASATTYYVNSQTNNSTQSGSWLFPWKTLASVNAANLKAGDKVLLQCGSTWGETLKVKSGVTYVASNVSCSNAPIITGSTLVGALTWQRDSSDTRPVHWADLSSINPEVVTQLIVSTSSGRVRLQRARHPNVVKDASTGNVISRYARLDPVYAADGSVAFQWSNPQFPASSFTSEQQQAIAIQGWQGAKLYTNMGGYTMQRYTMAGTTGNITTTMDPESTSMYHFPYFGGTPYWLENKRWMLDAEGEWYYDAATKRLYVYMPGGTSPQGTQLFAAVRSRGIEALGATNFTVSNVVVRETAHDAIYMENPSGFTVNKLIVNLAGHRGIYVRGGTSGNIQDSVISGSMAMPISMGDIADNGANTGSGINVIGNTITKSGDQFYAYAGIKMARASQAKDNVLTDLPGMGILADREADVYRNTLKRICMAAEDCGAIYILGRDDQGNAGYALNASIRSNFVDGVYSSTDGLAQGEQSAGGRGIYVDDFANEVRVSSNYVTNAGTGVLLHYAKNIGVFSNVLVGNRVTQFSLLEGDPYVDCSKPEHQASFNPCDGNFMTGNQVFSNVMVAKNNNASLVTQRTQYQSTSDMATYASNWYVGMSNAPFVDVTPEHLGETMSYSRWIASGKENAGTRYYANLPIVTSTPVAMSVPPASNGWQGWGTALSVNGATLQSTSSVAEGDAGIFMGTTLPIEKGYTYALRFDAKLAQPGDVDVLLGQANQGRYPTLADPVTFHLGTQWQTVERPLAAWKSATATVNVPNGSLGRLVFTRLGQKSLSLTNIQLVKTKRELQPYSVLVFENGATQPKSYSDCGYAGHCGEYINVKTGAVAAFPLTVAANSTEVLVWSNRQGKDQDDDGVEDSKDTSCPATSSLQTANGLGCVGLQP